MYLRFVYMYFSLDVFEENLKAQSQPQHYLHHYDWKTMTFCNICVITLDVYLKLGQVVHSYMESLVTLSKKTYFRLFWVEKVCKRYFWIWQKSWKAFQKDKKHWEKEKLLNTSNFSFSYSCNNFSFHHSVFKILVLQTCKNQGLFGKGLNQE